MLVTLESIAHSFGSRLIFKDINFTIKPGVVTLLAGPNGAGKTTFLHIIAGLTEPSSGKVTYVKEDISIAMLGHQTFLYPELTALENLQFWSNIQGIKSSRHDLLEALKVVELLPFAEEKCGIFSRGMAQRLSIARVLQAKPDLLLLDEPGSGLDLRSTSILHKEIQKAKDSGTAVMWISHTAEADKKFADQMVYLEEQKMTFHDSLS